MANSRNQQFSEDELKDELNKLLLEHESTLPRRENEPVPEEKFSTYLKNFIYKRTDDYYCNLCEENFKSSPSIMEHLNDPEHMNVVIDKLNDQEVSDDSVISEDFCKFLVQNNIFRHDLLLKCYSCELIIESHDDVHDHIISSDHKLQTYEFRVLKYAETSKNVGAIPKKNPFSKLTQTPLSDLKDDFVKYFENFIGKHGDIYLCHVCNIKLLSMSAVLSHMNQNHHKNSLTQKMSGHEGNVQRQHDLNRYKLLIENGIFQLGSYFWCNACQCILDLYRTAQNHSRKSKHTEKLNHYFNSCPEEPKKLLVSKTNEEAIVQKYPNCLYFFDQTDDEKMLTCFICSVTQLWRKHKNTVEHNLRKELYFESFTDTPGDQVLCLVCRTTLSKSSVIDHASKEHQLMPWYRPPDEFITYFRNFIQPMDKKYYCHLCQEINYRWYLAINHVKDIKHSRCVEGSVIEIDISQQPLTPDFCEEMSNNGIFPFNVRQLKCWTCEYIFESYNNVQRHILSYRHIIQLEEKKSKILSRLCKPPISLDDIILEFPAGL